MAAGLGSRMRPLTDHCPKTMVKVSGRRIIDRLLDGLAMHGIDDITIVTGYCSERFSEVVSDYPHVKLLKNPYYDIANNISSLYVARDLLEDAIILEADLVLDDPKILAPTFSHSGYCATYQDGKTVEWVFTLDEDDRITKCHPEGGSDTYRMIGISFWTAEDALRLKELVKEYFEKKCYDIYWDNLPLLLHLDTFDLRVRNIPQGSVIEVDTVEELATIDPTYRTLLEGVADESKS